MGGAGQGVFSDASNSVWNFNVKSREWKSMSGLHTARAGHGCAFLPTKAYVVVSGGYSLGMKLEKRAKQPFQSSQKHSELLFLQVVVTVVPLSCIFLKMEHPKRPSMTNNQQLMAGP